MKEYVGYIIDKSIGNKKVIKELPITNRKKIWLGLITILEIKVSEKEFDNLIVILQENMTTQIGFFKQEFYIHFYCGNELIVVFRQRVFHITSDKETWGDAISYGKNIGIIEKQLDFLSPEENQKRYFS